MRDSENEFQSVLGGGEWPEGETMRLRLTLALITAVHLGFTVIGAVNLVRWSPTTTSTVTSLFMIFVCSALQLFHCNPFTHRARTRFGLWTLSLQTVLTLIEIPVVGVPSGTMLGFLSGAVLTVFRGVLGWLLYLGLNALCCTVAMVQPHGPGTLYLALSSLAIGLIMYCLTQLGELVLRQHRARARAAWIAVSSERLRFARDLHDVLGHSLSAILLKTELAHRLLGPEDEKARTELAESMEIARRALSDVRAVVTGYRSNSLTDELNLVIGVLNVAEIDVQVEGDPGEPGPQVSTALSALLREAVTNLLQHSRATRCRISFRVTDDRLELTMSNDGVQHPRKHAPHPTRGTGLESLAARLDALEGQFHAETVDGWFRLHASCPSQVPTR